MKREYKDSKVKEAWLHTYEKGKNVEINIWVKKEHRGNHIGEGLLKKVTNDADNEGVTLCAVPEPEDNGDFGFYEDDPNSYEEKREKLIKLYNKFGFEFEPDDELGRCMIRKPRESEATEDTKK